VDRIPTFEKFNHSSFIKETYHLVEGHMSYDEYDKLIGESFFSFIKGLFTNPLQKRKLDKLGQDLLKTKIELMKLEIEEDSIDSFKSQLDQMKRGDNEYETANDKIEIADKAKENKIKSLQDRESLLVDQMDLIGGESEKLQKYVDKVKFEIRIKANDATIRIADGEIQRVLRDLKARDMKVVRDLDKEINKIN
jgi:hypothetical protein